MYYSIYIIHFLKYLTPLLFPTTQAFTFPLYVFRDSSQINSCHVFSGSPQLQIIFLKKFLTKINYHLLLHVNIFVHYVKLSPRLNIIIYIYKMQCMSSAVNSISGKTIHPRTVQGDWVLE